MECESCANQNQNEESLTESVTGVRMKTNWPAIKSHLVLIAKIHYQKIGMAIALLLFCVIYFSQGSEGPTQKSESPDTYIPAGYVLVPIEVVNKEALQSLLGNFGVVDLYVPALEPGKLGRKAASRVKILRAPLNPEEFAVLVREGEAFQLVHNDNGFFVVIQNPKQNGTRIVKPLSRSSRISFEDG